MAERKKWHSGPPPAIGWYPASDSRAEGFYRWWDGSSWSLPAFRGDTLAAVEKAASEREWMYQRIEWRERPATWPRIDQQRNMEEARHEDDTDNWW